MKNKIIYIIAICLTFFVASDSFSSETSNLTKEQREIIGELTDIAFATENRQLICMLATFMSDKNAKVEETMERCLVVAEEARKAFFDMYVEQFNK